MAIYLNKFGNCTTDYKGTGLALCDITELGDLVGFAALKKGWSKLIATDSFDLATWKNDVKSFDIFPFIGINSFTQDTPDNEENTSSTGVISTIRSAKPQFSFMYEKGGCFHKALYDKKSGQWDYALIFETGILLATSSDGLKLKGFKGGRLGVETFKLVQGTDPQMSTAKIQLLDAEEFNARPAFFKFTEVGDLEEVTGAIETTITVDAISAGGTFTASIVSGCNADSNILDLDDPANFVLLGTQASPTTISTVTYVASTNKYSFAVTPDLVATDTVQVKLSDGTYDAVEDSLGSIFKGTSNTIIVS